MLLLQPLLMGKVMEKEHCPYELLCVFTSFFLNNLLDVETIWIFQSERFKRRWESCILVSLTFQSQVTFWIVGSGE